MFPCVSSTSIFRISYSLGSYHFWNTHRYWTGSTTAQLYVSFSARISVILKSSTSEFKYGSPVVLTCEHSKIYRPYTIMWYRVKGRKFSKIQGTGNKYHIPQLSHYHNARYACRIMSCKPTPCRLLQESRSVQIELSGKLSAYIFSRLKLGRPEFRAAS